jgi:2-methylcitrate dehydratase PrpD
VDASILPEQRLSRFAAGLAQADIPDAVLHEAKRSLVNVSATALAASREPAVEIALETMLPFAGAAACSLVGRPERTDALLAAFVNAMAANIFDFDDTHEATIIHPAAVLFAALLARAETAPSTGEELLRAFVIGVECRMGNARVGFSGGRRLIDAIWAVDRLTDVGEVMRLSRTP